MGNAVPRGARARVVRHGLLVGWTNDQIIDKINELYPGQNRKNVQTLISRYREFVKPQATSQAVSDEKATTS